MARHPKIGILPRKIRTQIAARADVDERTVHRFLAGERKTLPIVARAIHEAAKRLGVYLGVTP